MLGILAGALALTAVLCIALGYGCWHLCAVLDLYRIQAAEERKHCQKVLREKDEFLGGILAVLRRGEGGIAQRLSESVEIAETIHARAPELLDHCASLAHWLHANDQFLEDLFVAAAKQIDDEQSRRVWNMKCSDRKFIFRRIYERAGVSITDIRKRSEIANSV